MPATAIEATLKQLNAWFIEPSEGNDRAKLLSKLSVLELCGWLEGEFDRLALMIDSKLLNDQNWVKEYVIDKTNGFAYVEHWRPMLVRLVGEVIARRVERGMETTHPGDLDQLKSLLSSLWKLRCAYAHADMVANVASQQSFQAPSWAQNQHRLLNKLITRYEQVLTAVISSI
ncbi:MAG TPA: hypothetical protein VN283_12540 [Thiobacillus sp.]|nr:hypothetical protein [Thiobacillus sp.]